MDDPYKEAAPGYLALGFHPLFLPYGQKHPPPRSFTGYHASPVTAGLVRLWSHSQGNVALRMPRGVVAIDIDAYHDGLATLAALEATYGPLPPTWSSTSRTDGSRCQLYRCEVDLPGALGTGIEVVQWFHRYLVVAPSLHPKTGFRYRTSDPDGNEVEYPPPPSGLPALPTAWLTVQQLGRERVGAERSEPRRRRRAVRVAPTAPDHEVTAFIEAHTANRWPESWAYVAEYLDSPSARHDRLLHAACMVVRDAVRGRYPASVGVERLRAWWREAMDDPDRRCGPEFDNAVRWAIAQGAGNDDDDAMRQPWRHYVDMTTWDGRPIPTPRTAPSAESLIERLSRERPRWETD